jgi:hypothetical protein
MRRSSFITSAFKAVLRTRVSRALKRCPAVSSER